MMKRIIHICLVFALALPSAEAQTANATVSGTVIDSAGSVVPDAAIRVKNLDTSFTQSVLTDDSGRFRIANLPLGNYEIEASKPGFKVVSRKGVAFSVGSQNIVDFSLPVGQLEETLFVEAPLTQVDTTSSAMSAMFSEQQLRDLPLNGRNFTALASMATGIAPAPMGTVFMLTFYGSGDNHSVSGARAEGQSFLLDNTETQGFWNRGTGSGATGTTLGVEALAGFQVLTSTYGAQFGGNGAVVNAATKSGTNAFHGSIYEFFRNSVLDARNFFDAPSALLGGVLGMVDQSGGPPPFRRNQFGASLGGPLRKDKVFFFFNYEGLRQSQGQTQIAFVPTAQARSGIIHPSIRPMLDLYPLPNGRNLAGGVGEYRSAADLISDENYFLGRMDWNISSKDSVFARYVSDRADSIWPFAGGPVPSWPENDRTANQYFTMQESRVVSPSVVNLLRFSFVRPVETGRNVGSHNALQLFPGLGRGDAQLQVGGISLIGSNPFLPFSLTQNKFTYADDVTWTRPNHTFRFGAAIERIQSNAVAPFRSSGVYVFNNLQQFLSGVPFRFVGVAPGNDDATRDFREAGVTPYFHDEWRVRLGLVLNLGLRYEFGTNPVGVRHPLDRLLDPPNDKGFTTVTHVFESSPNSSNWDPRAGFAWDPFNDHKTSIRGGFGIFHDRVAPRSYYQALQTSPPLIQNAIVFPPFPNPFAVAVGPPAISTDNGIVYRLPSAPYQMQWNLNMQRQIFNGTLTVGYAGSRGVHLLVPRDLNPPRPVSGPDGLPRYGTLTPGGVVANPRINPAFGRLVTLAPDGNSNYNSLQISFNRPMVRNVSAMLFYTWSKCIDNGSASFLPEEGGTDATQSVARSNPYDARADRGRCTFDFRHVFRGNTMVRVPFGENRFLGGWKASAIVMANTGRPFTVTNGFDQAGFLNATMARSRPDLVAGCDPILGRVDQWYDPRCFRVPPVGRPGSLGRNTLTAPGMFVTDFALLKDIRMRESASLEFRAEFFNIFNHSNFGLPSLDLFVPDGTGGGTVSPFAGQITTTATPPRQIQFGLKILF